MQSEYVFRSTAFKKGHHSQRCEGNQRDLGSGWNPGSRYTAKIYNTSIAATKQTVEEMCYPSQLLCPGFVDNNATFGL